MRAAIYARVSTGAQDTANQVAQLRAFILSQGWTGPAEYLDVESGGRSDRSGFLALLDAAARREFDVLVFWSLDRLTREGAAATLGYLSRFDSYGVRYRSFTEPYLDSCGIFGDAVVSILATIAKQERVRISERVRAGLERARAEGVQLGRPRRVVDSVKVAELRAAGLTWRAVARKLGVSTATAHSRGGAV